MSNRNKVAPIYLVKLKEKLGAKVTAEEIGCSDSYVSSAGSASCPLVGQTIEKMAKILYNELMDVKSESLTKVYIEIPANKEANLREFVKFLGGKFGSFVMEKDNA